MHCVNRIKFCGCSDNHFYISPSLLVMSVTVHNMLQLYLDILKEMTDKSL